MPSPITHDPDLIVYGYAPFNAEPTLRRLRRDYVTPQSHFYVRSHGAIPEIDETTHRLRVDGLVSKPLDLTMADLRERFTIATVMATMQCAGNRRADMAAVNPVVGDYWAGGAIGNAEWTGVRLGDVLVAAGANERDDLHVAFAALDECEVDGEHFRYGASVAINKARSPEVLLAWAMNGEPLQPEHGHPLRVVVPGYAGARSPKWLGAITVQDKPSEAHPQARDYKLFPPDVTKDTADWSKGVTIEQMPVNSAICEPAAFSTLAVGSTAIRGWAQASARAIVRVDVSSDGGRTWRQAELRHDGSAPWSWTFWETDIDLPIGEHELVCRAWDAAGQTQPAMPDDTWNFKGYLSAAWHRARVRVA